MGTRVTVGGRVVWQRGVVLQRVSHNEKTCHSLPPAQAAPSQAGEIWVDELSKIAHRIVPDGKLTPAGGWGTQSHWMGYFSISAIFFERAVLRGRFDAAIEVSASVPRYRCLDAGRLLLEIHDRVGMKTRLQYIPPRADGKARSSR